MDEDDDDDEEDSESVRVKRRRKAMKLVRPDCRCWNHLDASVVMAAAME